jgi:putative transposase
VNRRRVQRLYQEEGFAICRRRKRRRARAARVTRTALTGPKQRWSVGLLTDTLSTGPRFRCLTIVEEWSRESPAIYSALSIPAVQVLAVLAAPRGTGDLPPILVTDNGPEITRRAFNT